MTLAEGFVNDNSISAIALGFFTALTGLLGIVIKGVFDTRAETKRATTEAQQANKSAIKARENTQNVSNGFASTVLGRLESIDEKTDDLHRALRSHLEWHVNHPSSEVTNPKSNDG